LRALFGGFVTNKKHGKIIDPIIMLGLTILGVYAALTGPITAQVVVGILLISLTTYVTFRPTTRLIPEPIRHTWVSGLVFVIVGALLGWPFGLLYTGIGILLLTADVARHRHSGRGLTEHSGNCQMRTA